MLIRNVGRGRASGLHRSGWKFQSLPISLSVKQNIGEGNGNPLQCSCLENPMDGGAWWAAVHGVTKSRTWLSDFTFTFHFHALEKEMATHSSVIAWRIPGMGEPGGLPSVGSHRVGYNWSNLAAAAAWTDCKSKKKNQCFEKLSSLILRNSESFLAQIVTSNKKWIL